MLIPQKTGAAFANHNKAHELVLVTVAVKD
jgi:hypothetical protein